MGLYLLKWLPLHNNHFDLGKGSKIDKEIFTFLWNFSKSFLKILIIFYQILIICWRCYLFRGLNSTPWKILAMVCE